MKKAGQILIAPLALFLGYLALPSLTFASKTDSQLNRLVVFGDGDSDSGNIWRLSKQSYPGKRYFRGRLTNGMNWVGALKDMINTSRFVYINNYAYANAQIEGKHCFFTHNAHDRWHLCAPDLTMQINNYLRRSTRMERRAAVALVFIGTNDVLTHYGQVMRFSANFIKGKQAIIKKNIQRLLKSGFKDVVVFGLRKIDLMPISQRYALAYGKRHRSESQLQSLSRLKFFTVSWNSALRRWARKNKHVHFYNTYRFDRVLSQRGPSWRTWGNRSSLKLITGSPCYNNNNDRVDMVRRACSRPNDFFYFDLRYPTTQVHWLMASDLYVRLLSHIINSPPTNDDAETKKENNRIKKGDAGIDETKKNAPTHSNINIKALLKKQ